MSLLYTPTKQKKKKQKSDLCGQIYYKEPVYVKFKRKQEEAYLIPPLLHY